MLPLVKMRRSDYQRAQSRGKLNVWPLSSMVTFCSTILKLALLVHSLSSSPTPPPVLELGQEGSFHSGNHFHSINWMKTKAGAMPCGYCFTSRRCGLNFRLPGQQGHKEVVFMEGAEFRSIL